MKKKAVLCSSLFALTLKAVELPPPFLNLERQLPNEAQIIERTISALRAASLKGFETTDQLLVRRAAHPKGHGLVRAEFWIEPEELEKVEALHGTQDPLLTSRQRHQAVIRFSNALGDHDLSDMRGMAVRIFDVAGSKLFDPPSQAVDLLAINMPQPVANSEEFLHLAEGFRSFARFSFANSRQFLRGFSIAQRLLRMKLRGSQTASLLAERYESQMFYALDEKTVIRFAWAPIDPWRQWVQPWNAASDPNYLSHDLKRRLEGDIHRDSYLFGLFVHVRAVDEVTVDEIEDGTYEPTSGNYGQLIGRLRIPAQELAPELDAVAEGLAFNRWRNNWRPLGSIGRAARYAYEALASERRLRNHWQVDNEPDSWAKIMRLFNLDSVSRKTPEPEVMSEHEIASENEGSDSDAASEGSDYGTSRTIDSKKRMREAKKLAKQAATMPLDAEAAERIYHDAFHRFAGTERLLILTGLMWHPEILETKNEAVFEELVKMSKASIGWSVLRLNLAIALTKRAQNQNQGAEWIQKLQRLSDFDRYRFLNKLQPFKSLSSDFFYAPHYLTRNEIEINLSNRDERLSALELAMSIHPKVVRLYRFLGHVAHNGDWRDFVRDHASLTLRQGLIARLKHLRELDTIDLPFIDRSIEILTSLNPRDRI